MTDKLITALIAAALVVAAIVGILYVTRKNRVELTGEVLKIRSYMIDPEDTIAVIDLRISNPSTQQFMVKDVDVRMEFPDGQTLDGDIFTEIDAQRVLEYYPVLGPKYNPTLVIRNRINPGQTIDRMLAAKFATTDERLQQRKRIRISLTDADGAKTEILEKR